LEDETMKKLVLQISVVGLMVAAAFFMFAACNGAPDTAEVDDYFSSYPYVSLSRPGSSGNLLQIAPAGASVEHNGDRINLVASGGTPPYRWSVDQTARGTLEKVSGWEAIYQRDLVGNNIVILTDADGQEAYCLITQGGGDLQILPSTVTLEQNSQIALLTAVGGLPGYTWSVVYTNLGNVSASSGTTVEYQRYAENDNTILLVDSRDVIAEFTIHQPAVLVLSPSIANITTNQTATFTASGGTTPYSWTVLDPGLGSVSAGVYTPTATIGTNYVTVWDAKADSVTAPVVQTP
jgi:hypothetical protein